MASVQCDRLMPVGPPKQKISYHFAPVSQTILEDGRVSDGALRAYCFMLCARPDMTGNLCSIGERRLAAALARSPRTTHTYLHELIDAGYINPVAGKRRGQRGTYRFAELGAANGFSTLGNAQTEVQQSTAKSAANRFSTVQQTASARIRKSNSRIGSDLKNEHGRELLFEEIVELLGRCPLNGKTAEEEARRLDERLPRMRSYLVGHLTYAISEKLEDPISYAERQTQYGAIPLPRRESGV